MLRCFRHANHYTGTNSVVPDTWYFLLHHYDVITPIGSSQGTGDTCRKKRILLPVTVCYSFRYTNQPQAITRQRVLATIDGVPDL